MRNTINIGVVNFTPVVEDKVANIDKMSAFIEEAALKGVELLAFPEMSLTGFIGNNAEKAISLAETIDGFAAQKISQQAVSKNMYIIYGATEKSAEPDKAYDSAFVCAPDGSIKTVRRIQTEKFDWCLSAEKIDMISTPWGNIGIGVGDDIIEYPETERIMIGWDCNLILSISATKSHVTDNPKTWEWYIKNRIDSITARDAIRIAFVNQTGNGFPGGSCVARPQSWNVLTDYMIGNVNNSSECLFSDTITIDKIPEGAINLENNFVPRVFAKMYQRIADDQKNGIYHTAKKTADGPLVALAKTTAKWGDTDANITMMTEYIENAAQNHADIIIFPETILHGYQYLDPKPGEEEMHTAHAEPVPGPASNKFAALSSKYNMYIMYGFEEKVDDLIYNSAAIICPDGRQLTYRKFSPHGPENLWCTSGTEPLMFDTKWGKAGVIICMDGHSEPEIGRYYAANGCSFVLHCATTSGNSWYRQVRLLPYVDRDGMGFATTNTTGTDGPSEERKYFSVSYVANPYIDSNGNPGYDSETGAAADLHGLAKEPKDDQGLVYAKMNLSNVGYKQVLNAELYAKEYEALADKMEKEQTYLYDLWNSHNLEAIRKVVKEGLIKPATPTRFNPKDPVTKEDLACALASFLEKQ